MNNIINNQQEIDEFSPMHNDILVHMIPQSDIFKSDIIIIDSEEKNKEMSYFKVLKVSPLVTDVVVGDTIILPHLGHTPPFELGGIMCAVVGERDVVGVLDE